MKENAAFIKLMQFVVVYALILMTSAIGWAQISVNSSCTASGAAAVSPGGDILVCSSNSGNYQRGETFTANGSNILVGIGIGTSSTPQLELDVNGGARVGYDTANCGTANAGEWTYNGGYNAMEYCNGTAWQLFTPTATVVTHGCTVTHTGSGSCTVNSGSYNGSCLTVGNDTLSVAPISGQNCSITFKTWGGGGGGGNSGGNGGGGGFSAITESIATATNFCVSVGGGGGMETYTSYCSGGNGGADGAATPGSGGTAVTGYTGGAGGLGGCYSHASATPGAGGGGATTIWMGTTTCGSGTLISVAAGGGGAAGPSGSKYGGNGYAGGIASIGGAASTTYGATGGNSSIAGGTGGGGGGGGYQISGGGGGTGGVGLGTYTQALGGYGGVNYVSSGGNTMTGSGTAPGGSGDPNYPSNAGSGGVGNETTGSGATAGGSGAIYYSW